MLPLKAQNNYICYKFGGHGPLGSLSLRLCWDLYHVLWNQRLRRSQDVQFVWVSARAAWRKKVSTLHIFCRCDKLSSSLHKEGVNYAASQRVKVAHNQGGLETEGGFAKKWERTKQGGGRISRDLFTARFVANVVSHVTQYKFPIKNLGVFYFSSITLIEYEQYSFLVSDQSKTSTLWRMTRRTNYFDHCCGLFFNHRGESFRSS